MNAPVFGMLPAIQVSASDENTGDVVSLTSSTLPAFATFAAAAGNPASATLTLRPGFLDWLFGLFMPAGPVTITAMDNATPPLSATCVIAPRVTLFGAF